jgi:hypothetical protein
VTNRVRNHPAGRLVVQGGSPRSASLRLAPSSRVRRATGGRAIYPPGGDRRRSAATAGESGSPAHRRGCGGVRARVVGVRARAPPGPTAAPTVVGKTGEQRYGRRGRGLSRHHDSPTCSKTLTGLYLWAAIAGAPCRHAAPACGRRRGGARGAVRQGGGGGRQAGQRGTAGTGAQQATGAGRRNMAGGAGAADAAGAGSANAAGAAGAAGTGARRGEGTQRARHPPDGVIHPAAAPFLGHAPYVIARTPRPASAWALAAFGLTATAVWYCGLLRHARVAPAALHLRCSPPHPPSASESVSVLLPVRHGPETAIAAVCAALTQRGVEHLDVVVLDDGCPAETRAALRRQFGDDPRVRILAAAPRPPGWSPLAHRSHQLAVAARGSVLIFAEPCAPLGPHAAASATALLRRERLDLAVLDSGRPAPLPPASPRVGPVQTAGLPPWIHPGRFALAVDAASYWRIGGYRSAANDSHPLSLLRTVRRASGRAAVADGRRVIPPAKLIPPVVHVEANARGTEDSATWPSWPSWAGGESAQGTGTSTGAGAGSGSLGRSSLGDSARRVLSSLVGTRA